MTTSPPHAAPAPWTERARSYRTHAGLPALAGLGSMEQAIQPGLPVAESVRRLKRHHYILRRLHSIWVARITAEPVYEIKMAFSLHAHLAAENVSALRARVGEMREPPLGLEDTPHPGLALLLDEILAAADTAELLLGLYEVVLPALRDAMERHRAETHVLADQPTRCVLRIAVAELDEMLDWGRAAVSAIVSPEDRLRASGARQTWEAAIAAAGGIDGCHDTGGPVPPPRRSATPWRYDRTPRRDERFADPYNMGVNAEVFLYDPAMPSDAKVLMMYYKRLREIDVPEMMASIIAETPGKPWGYYRDMTRQLWDEARHAMLGEVGFVAAGVDWPREVRVNFTWSLGLNTQLQPLERHAVLYFIEQGLMPKTGKRHEWEVALAAENPLAATIQDFDWADEVLHARIGRDWYVAAMPSPHEAIQYGDRCWSKVLMGWREWRDAGLTSHANWWPPLYANWCARESRPPHPAAAAYAVTYEAVRADLKDVSGPA